MSMRSFAVSLVMAGAVLAAMPADATTFTFNTVGNSGVNGAYGNVRTFSATDGTTTINLKATAWQADEYNFKISNAFLGAYAQGLGVTGKNDYNGNYYYHQIDNVRGYDFILLQFDQAVSITGLNRQLFGLPFVGYDSDASIKAVSLGGAQWNSALDISGYTLGTKGWTSIGGGSLSGLTTFAGNVTSTQWLIAADIASGKNDGFKLKSLQVNYNVPVNAVPEPATWAMMLTGFGLVGAAARRRRAVEAIA
jgi:hypothetical protein